MTCQNRWVVQLKDMSVDPYDELHYYRYLTSEDKKDGIAKRKIAYGTIKY